MGRRMTLLPFLRSTMRTSGDDASSFLSRRQMKESDSSVCHGNQGSARARGQEGGSTTDGTRRRWWSYTGVEGDGGLVDAQAAELEQLLELNWQGRRHGDVEALGCARLEKGSSQLVKSCVLLVDGSKLSWGKLGIVTLKGVEIGGAGRDTGRNEGGATNRITGDCQKAISETKGCSITRRRKARSRAAVGVGASVA